MLRGLIVAVCVAVAGCVGSDGSSQGPAAGASVSAGAEMKACLANLQRNTLKVGQENAAIPEVAKPAKGVVFADPVYGSCLVRATAHDQEPPKGFARNDYSRRQAFNADSSRFFVYAFDGQWHLYDANTFAWLQQLPGLASDAEPQWHPEDPDKLYFLPTNGVGMTVNELTVSSGAIRTVGDLAGRLQARWPAAAAASTRSEGSPSRDARWWAFLVDNAAFESVGIVVWDRVEDEIVAMLDSPSRPDHLSMSPSGKHVVVSWDDRTVALDRNLQNERVLLDRGEHSDVGIGANGNDVYVSIDYGSNDGWMFMVDLETGERTDLVRTYVNGTATAMHFSAKAYERPGWVLVSTYARVKQQEWLHDKIFILQLGENPKVIPLAHHHSVSAGYWSEPHASVNRDFSRVLFTSNWNVSSETDVDTYYILLPDNVVPAP